MACYPHVQWWEPNALSTCGSYTTTYLLPPPIGFCTTTYPLPPPMGPAPPPTHSLHQWVLYHSLSSPSTHGPCTSTRSLHLYVLHLYLPAPSTHGSCTTTYLLTPPMVPVATHSIHPLVLVPTRSLHPWVLHRHLPPPSTRGPTPHLYYSPCRSTVWRSTCRTSCRRRASPWAYWMSRPSAGSCTYTSYTAWGLHPPAAGCKYITTTVEPHV